MIIYQATKAEFLQHVRREDMDEVMLRHHRAATGGGVGKPQLGAWAHSLQQMGKILEDEEIPEDAGVAIEYQLPQTSKRIDFLITGLDEAKRPRVVIVELKQWSQTRLSDNDGIIWARRGGGAPESEGTHPSYQAWTYAAFLKDFNEAIYDGGIAVQPCAYLHNHPRDGVVDAAHYAKHIERAPLFLKEDRARLQAFIRQHVRRGDQKRVLYSIEEGRIRPSKPLADSIKRLMQGHPEFILIDDQKLAYEAVMKAVKQSKGAKQVVIVEGGPGTGKSVIAVNLMAALSAERLNARYVSKNAAPRDVYRSRLAGTFRTTEINNFFSGSGAFTSTQPDAFDVLIVDEAHRLNEKGGLYGNQGDHQVRELVRSARCTVFFVDDDQRIALTDIGHTSELLLHAQEQKANVVRMKLDSQFRCSGSDGYLAWVDDVTGVRETANKTLDTSAYDFRVLDSPAELHELIEKKNARANKARVVAGYCWPWKSKKDPAAWDIVIPEHDYRRRWNLTQDGSLWIVAPESVREVGCIHTCQGLEVEYVGVIIGPDLVYRDGKVTVDVTQRAKADKTIKGLGKIRKADPARAEALANMIVRNTYRTLMTRGMKGCYVYCVDKPLGDFLRSRLAAISQGASDDEADQRDAGNNGSHFRRFTKEQRRPGVAYAPIFDLKIAAGGFSHEQTIDDMAEEFVELQSGASAAGLFVAQVVGESMNRVIPNGAWCLFRANPQGPRQGKVVLVQHRDIRDQDHGATYTVKKYLSEKVHDADGGWLHSKIVLRPNSTEDRFHDFVISGVQEDEFRVVAEFIALLPSLPSSGPTSVNLSDVV